MHFYYGSNGRPAVVMYNNVAYGYLYNLQGDVVGLVDAAGNVMVQYKYDAWGKPLSCIGSAAATVGYWQPFRYRGYVFDEETGLYYLKSRYYSFVNSRFINCDIVGEGLRYSYCDNNPIIKTDYDGLLGVFFWAAVIGAAVSAVSSVVTQYVTTGEVDAGVVAIDAFYGGISGMAAASGVSLATSALIGASLGGANYVSVQAYKHEEINVIDLSVSVGAGAIGGVISGSGSDAKPKMEGIASLNKAISREARRANVAYAAKRTAKMVAQRKAYQMSLSISAGRYAISVANSYFLNSQTMHFANYLTD